MTFNGFISYSHAADGRLAPAVQRGLHELAKPWHRRRALWIFRDQTGLAVTPDLWSSIQRALDSSEYFVLLASPEAAASPWVNREIEHWVATKSADRILPVVTDGHWQWDPAGRDFAEDATAVPEALRGVFAEEPLYLDLRWARDDRQLSLRHSRFRDAIAQLAAPMHGVSKDELEGEDVRQHRRVRRLRSGAVATLATLTLAAVLTGVLAVQNARRANAAAAEARRQQLVAVEQHGSAQRSAAEARRQEEQAKQQQARANAAADETRRQQQLTKQQKALADHAAADAGRQQQNAQHQQQIADQAAARARQQEQLARQQRALATQWAETARQQQQVAQQQEQVAKQASDEAARQQRIATSRRLLTQATATMGSDPKTALMLGLAAQKIQPDADTRNHLTGLVTSTHYAGGISGAADAAYTSHDVLAVVDDDGTVSLWRVADRAHPVRLATFDGGKRHQTAISSSPDGRILAVADYEGGVVLWNIADPAHPVRAAALPGLTGATSVTFSPDGHTVVTTGSGEPGATLWDVADVTLPRRLSALTADAYWPGEVAFSADGRTLVTNDSAMVWDVTDRARPVLLGTLPDGTQSNKVAFSPDHAVVATGYYDGTVILWDLTDRAHARRLATLPSQSDHTSVADDGAVAFSPDGRTLAVSDDTLGKVTLWDVADPANPVLVDSVGSHLDAVGSVAFSPDGRTLASLDGNGLTFWNVAYPGAPLQVGELSDHSGDVIGLALDPTGRSLAVARYDGSVRFWDVADPAHPVARATVSAIDRRSIDTEFSRDLRTVAAAAWDGPHVTLTDVTDLAHPVTLTTINLETIHPEASDVMVAFSPDGRILATGDDTDEIILWDLADRAHPTRLGTLTGVGTGGPSVILFSPDGRTVAALAEKGIGLWNVANPRTPVRLTVLPDRNGAAGMAFSPDGHTFATGNNNDTVSLWDVTDPTHGSSLATLTGYSDQPYAVAFGPDGHTLTTGTQSGTIVIWDVTDKQDPVRLATLKRSGLQSSVVVLSPNGHTLVAGGNVSDDDHDQHTPAHVTLWDYTELNQLRVDPARQTCTITGGGLTPGQWAHYIPELAYQRTCP